MIFLYIILGILAIIVIGVVVRLALEYWWLLLIAALLIGGVVFLIRRKKGRKPAKQESAERHDYEVVGESHYRDNIQSLGEPNPDFHLTKKQLFDAVGADGRAYEFLFRKRQAQLVPEPENKHDPNAIRVDVDGVKVGYIAASLTREVRPLIDSGRLQSVDATITGGRYHYLDYDLDDPDKEPKASDCQLKTRTFDYSVKLHLNY